MRRILLPLLVVALAVSAVFVLGQDNASTPEVPSILQITVGNATCGMEVDGTISVTPEVNAISTLLMLLTLALIVVASRLSPSRDRPSMTAAESASTPKTPSSTVTMCRAASCALWSPLAQASGIVRH